MNVQTKEELLPEEKQIEVTCNLHDLIQKWKFARVNRVKTTPAEVLSILKRIYFYTFIINRGLFNRATERTWY